jgi:hypothetical protein
MNSVRYAKLATQEFYYDTQKWGRQSAEWKLIPDRLYLKPGALVMALANGGNFAYVNGDLGHALGKDENGEVMIELSRAGRLG